MAVDRTSGPTGPAPTTNTGGDSPRANFQAELKNKSTEDVAKMAGDKGMQPWQRQEAMKELVNRAMQMLKDPENDMDDNEKKQLQKLMKMLQDAAGGKGDAGGKGGLGDLVAKLLEAMHVPGDIAKAIGDSFGKASGSEGDD